jgi:hypothetical protein
MVHPFHPFHPFQDVQQTPPCLVAMHASSAHQVWLLQHRVEGPEGQRGQRLTPARPAAVAATPAAATATAAATPARRCAARAALPSLAWRPALRGPLLSTRACRLRVAVWRAAALLRALMQAERSLGSHPVRLYLSAILRRSRCGWPGGCRRRRCSGQPGRACCGGERGPSRGRGRVRRCQAAALEARRAGRQRRPRSRAHRRRRVQVHVRLWLRRRPWRRRRWRQQAWPHPQRHGRAQVDDGPQARLLGQQPQPRGAQRPRGQRAERLAARKALWEGRRVRRRRGCCRACKQQQRGGFTGSWFNGLQARTSGCCSWPGTCRPPLARAHGMQSP